MRVTGPKSQIWEINKRQVKNWVDTQTVGERTIFQAGNIFIDEVRSLFDLQQ